MAHELLQELQLVQELEGLDPAESTQNRRVSTVNSEDEDKALTDRVKEPASSSHGALPW